MVTQMESQYSFLVVYSNYKEYYAKVYQLFAHLISNNYKLCETLHVQWESIYIAYLACKLELLTHHSEAYFKCYPFMHINKNEP